MSVAEQALSENTVSAPVRETDSIWTSERAVVWGLWIAWALACLPLLFTRILPAVDYPDHLARIYILAHALSLPGYAQFYQPHWAFLPNLAFDLVMVPLAKIMPIEVAGRLFVCALFALTIYGGARLNKALTGRWTWLALVPALLVYNRILAYGFMNFLCGLGLLLLAFAIHIEMREAKTAKRLLFETMFLCGLFACHLVAMCLYVACVIAYDAAKWFELKPIKLAILKDLSVVLLPAIILLGAFFKLSPMTGEAVRMEFRDWLSKSKLLHMTFQTGQGVWDMAFAFLVLLLLVWLLAYRKVRIDKAMVAPILLMCAIFVIAPTGFKQAMNVDTRIPLVLSLIIFVSFVPRARYSAQMVGACVLGLLLFRSVSTSVHYAKWQNQIDSTLADLREVPQGSVLLVTRNIDSHVFDAVSWNPPLMHLGCLLLLERPIMAQDLFTIPTEQPLLKKAPYNQIDLTAKVGGGLARNLSDYGRQAAEDAASAAVTGNKPVFLYYLRDPGKLVYPPELEPIVERSKYAIFKVDPSKLSEDSFVAPQRAEAAKRSAEEPERWDRSN